MKGTNHGKFRKIAALLAGGGLLCTAMGSVYAADPPKPAQTPQPFGTNNIITPLAGGMDRSYASAAANATLGFTLMTSSRAEMVAPKQFEKFKQFNLDYQKLNLEASRSPKMDGHAKPTALSEEEFEFIQLIQLYHELAKNHRFADQVREAPSHQRVMLSPQVRLGQRFTLYNNQVILNDPLSGIDFSLQSLQGAQSGFGALVGYGAALRVNLDHIGLPELRALSRSVNKVAQGFAERRGILKRVVILDQPGGTKIMRALQILEDELIDKVMNCHVENGVMICPLPDAVKIRSILTLLEPLKPVLEPLTGDINQMGVDSIRLVNEILRGNREALRSAFFLNYTRVNESGGQAGYGLSLSWLSLRGHLNTVVNVSGVTFGATGATRSYYPNDVSVVQTNVALIWQDRAQELIRHSSAVDHPADGTAMAGLTSWKWQVGLEYQLQNSLLGSDLPSGFIKYRPNKKDEWSAVTGRLPDRSWYGGFGYTRTISL